MSMIYQTGSKNERKLYTAPMPSSSFQSTLNTPVTAATTSGTTPSISPASTPATSQHDDAPGRLPAKQPALTQDFHLDTFFNPVWTSGPNVFTFAQDGTVVRPRTYAMEPYPGYHAYRPRRLESTNPSCVQGPPRGDPKPWKNVAITEQDEAEWEAFKERMRKGELGEWQTHPQGSMSQEYGYGYGYGYGYPRPANPRAW